MTTGLSVLWARVAIYCLLWGTSAIAIANEYTTKVHEPARNALRLAVELASDTTSPEDLKARNSEIDLVYVETVRADIEWQLVRNISQVEPDDEFETLVAPKGTRPADYLRAARRSYARFRGAERSGQREWMSSHTKATRKYAAQAAEGLLEQAKSDEDRRAKLESQLFAIRRPAEQSKLVLERLKREGWSAEQRQVLAENGLNADAITTYQKQISVTEPDNVGTSIVELYANIARLRRALAASLETVTGAHSSEKGPRSQTYLVGNPHDREETVDLFVRRASVPPEWKLSVVDAETTADGKPEQRVQEIEAGRHYRVQLPAQGQLTVASVVVPVGVVGDNTTVRWATEGRIGEELIGGIVHEMHGPVVLADLQLPPIAPAATSSAPTATPIPPAQTPTESTGTPSADSTTQAPGFRSPLVWLAAAISVLLIGILFIAWRRKRSRG